MEIRLNKNRILLLLFASLAFVLTGALFAIYPEKFIGWRISSSEVVFSLGIICLVFFGFGFIFSIYKLFDSKPGLTISERGILENTTIFNFGMVEWNDIKEFNLIKNKNSTLLLVEVINPDKYLERNSRLKREIAKSNLKYFGTPVQINCKVLKIKPEELLDKLESELKKYNLNS